MTDDSNTPSLVRQVVNFLRNKYDNLTNNQKVFWWVFGLISLWMTLLILIDPSDVGR